jgi:hypothetical protein
MAVSVEYTCAHKELRSLFDRKPSLPHFPTHFQNQALLRVILVLQIELELVLPLEA